MTLERGGDAYVLDRVVELVLVNFDAVSERRDVWAQRTDQKAFTNLGNVNLTADLSRAYTSFIVRFSPDIYAAEGVAIVDAGLSWNAYNLERIGRRRWINIEVDDVRTLVRHADLAPDTPDTPSGQPYNRWLNRNTFQAGERDGSYAIREAVLTLNVRDSEGADFAEPIDGERYTFSYNNLDSVTITWTGTLVSWTSGHDVWNLTFSEDVPVSGAMTIALEG